MIVTKRSPRTVEETVACLTELIAVREKGMTRQARGRFGHPAQTHAPTHTGPAEGTEGE